MVFHLWGKKWDYDVPSVEFWKEALRVLKPGGMALIFAGSRTQHRMAVNIEDAGFELRDTIMWVYGSGFPKSHDISRAIDKLPKATPRLKEFASLLKKKRIEKGISISQADKIITGGSTMYSFLEGRNIDGVKKIYPPNKKHYENICREFGIIGWSDIVDNNLLENGVEEGNFGYQKSGKRWEKDRKLYTTTTNEAKQWEGYGTALKPAYEPIIIAMKPIEGTYAENALKHGVAGLNIDGGRVETTKRTPASPSKNEGSKVFGKYAPKTGEESGYNPNIGRFPANLIHDGSEEVEALFPETGKSTGGRANQTTSDKYGEYANRFEKRDPGFGDSGSASRFFYCAKASKKDRGEGNNHPTVKPLSLMRYLAKLIKTPTGGVVLDPFMGSGTTGVACLLEGRDFIGIEREEEYYNIAKNRIENYQDYEEKELKKPKKKETKVEKDTILSLLGGN